MLESNYTNLSADEYDFALTYNSSYCREGREPEILDTPSGLGWFLVMMTGVGTNSAAGLLWARKKQTQAYR